MTSEKAIQILEARIKENPHSLLFARLADSYLKEGRVDEAIELCKEGLQYHPSYVTGTFVLGKAYIAKGDYEKAEEELKKVLSYDRQYLSAHKLLGDLMTKLGWENKAALHYKDILRIDPLEEKIRQLVETLSPESELQEVAPNEEKIIEEEENKEEYISNSEDEKIIENDIVEDWKEELEKAFPEKESETSTDIFEEQTSQQEESETLVPEETKQQDENKEEEFFFDFSEIEEENKSPEESSPSPLLEKNKTTEQTEQTEQTEETEETPLLFEEEVTPEKYENETSTIPPTEEPRSEETNPPIPPPDEAIQKTEENKESPSPASEKEQHEQGAQEPEPPTHNKGKKEKQIVSPTLGEIYTAQGQYAKAIKVYETLLEKKPGEKQYEEKIEELKRKLKESSSQ